MKSMILQVFDLTLDDPSYERRIKQTLTVKPRDYYLKATLRRGIDLTKLPSSMMSDLSCPRDITQSAQVVNGKAEDQKIESLTVLLESNTGTCQTLAQRFASEAEGFGFHAKVIEMDSAVNRLSEHRPVVIITSSYENQPPDNAAHFVEWLESLRDSRNLESLPYTVFGCGHSDCVSTFQRIPTLVYDMLGSIGGKRIAPRGAANAAKGDMFSNFDGWSDQVFWPAMKGDWKGASNRTLNEESMLEVQVSHQDRSARLRQDVRDAKVLEAKSLVPPGEPNKRHLEVLLPSHMAYEPGDYLAVLPLNSPENVQRVMKLSSNQIPWDATIEIKCRGSTNLPIDTPISVVDLLKGYVELAIPATRKVNPLWLILQS